MILSGQLFTPNNLLHATKCNVILESTQCKHPSLIINRGTKWIVCIHFFKMNYFEYYEFEITDPPLIQLYSFILFYSISECEIRCNPNMHWVVGVAQDTCHQKTCTLSHFYDLSYIGNVCWPRLCLLTCSPDMHWLVGVVHNMFHQINMHIIPCLWLVIVTRNTCWPTLCWMGCNPNTYYVVGVAKDMCH